MVFWVLQISGFRTRLEQYNMFSLIHMLYKKLHSAHSGNYLAGNCDVANRRTYQYKRATPYRPTSIFIVL